jgi:cobalt-zinc-cadmium resistance protein CzcA
MMTATVAALGLVPFLFASGPGSEIQRPLAIVGLVSSTALTLLLLPVVYGAFEGKGDARKREMQFEPTKSPDHASVASY